MCTRRIKIEGTAGCRVSMSGLGSECFKGRHSPQWTQRKKYGMWDACFHQFNLAQLSFSLFSTFIISELCNTIVNFYLTEAAISLRLGRILPGLCWCPSKQSIYVAGPCLNVVFTQCLLFPNWKHRWRFLFLKKMSFLKELPHSGSFFSYWFVVVHMQSF